MAHNYDSRNRDTPDAETVTKPKAETATPSKPKPKHRHNTSAILAERSNTVFKPLAPYSPV